jgi:hypothetical protein
MSATILISIACTGMRPEVAVYRSVPTSTFACSVAVLDMEVSNVCTLCHLSSPLIPRRLLIRYEIILIRIKDKGTRDIFFNPSFPNNAGTSKTTVQISRSIPRSTLSITGSDTNHHISVEEREKKRTTIPTCFDFNNENGCSLVNCKCAHRCAVCRSTTHGWSSCVRRRVCLAFSKGGCPLGSDCDSRHCCIVCHGQHRIGDIRCKLYSERVRKGDISMKYCLKWNATGRCDGAGNDHRHNCVYCRSPSHGSYACLHALVMLINE